MLVAVSLPLGKGGPAVLLVFSVRTLRLQWICGLPFFDLHLLFDFHNFLILSALSCVRERLRNTLIIWRHLLQLHLTEAFATCCTGRRLCQQRLFLRVLGCTRQQQAGPRCMPGGREAGSCAHREASARQRRTRSAGMARVSSHSKAREGTSADEHRLAAHVITMTISRAWHSWLCPNALGQ